MSCETRISPGAASALIRAGDVHLQPEYVLVLLDGFTRVDADPERERLVVHLDERHGTARGRECFERGTRTAERQEEAVTEVLDHLPVGRLHAFPHRLVVLTEHRAPLAITEPGGEIGRSDDVGDRDRHRLGGTQRSARLAQGIPQRDRLGIRLDSELVGKQLRATVVRAERLGPVAGERLGAHEHAVARLAERLERDGIGGERHRKRRVPTPDPCLREHVERADVPRAQVAAHGLDPRRVLAREERPARDRGRDRSVAAREIEVAAPQRTFGIVDSSRARLQIDPGVNRQTELVAAGGADDRLVVDSGVDEHGPQLADQRLERRVPRRRAACPATARQPARPGRRAAAQTAPGTRTRSDPAGRGMPLRRSCRRRSRAPSGP